jgi:signal transduction protein with GAF and PtsI domain
MSKAQKEITKKTASSPRVPAEQATQALIKISEAIASDLYLEDILKLIVTVTAETIDSKICSLMLLDEQNRELVVKATQSISESYNKKPNIKLGTGIAGQVALSGKPVAVLDVRKDERYANHEIAKKEKLCSLLCVPLVFRGKVIGVLNSYTSEPHAFSDHEIKILQSVAHQAAIVIENFKLVIETKVIKEELESRKFIERAKGILMEKNKIGEKEAYECLRRFSMDRRKTMKEIADAIILTNDLASGDLKKDVDTKRS